MKYVYYIMLTVLGIVLGTLINRSSLLSDRTVKYQTDTVWRRDTIVIEKPVPIKVTHKDTLLVKLRDTLRIKDTVYMVLDKEYKEYRNDEYYAKISGYQPSLDYIEVYPKTTYVKQAQSVTKCNRLRLGVEANYYSTPFVPIYLEYERMLHRNIGINAKFFYDFPTRLYGVGVGINAQIGW